MVKVQVNSQGKAYMTSNGKVLLSSGSSPVISSLNVTPTTSAQTITAESGVDGYSPVNVSAVTSSIDSNISAENIKKDVTILGVTGSYEGSGGSATLITKNITQNGTYSASSDNADGYSSVTVSVSGGGSSSKFGVSMDNIFGNVNNGVLGSPSSINGITFTGVTEIGPNALKNAFNDRVPVSGLIAFPDLTTIGDSGLDNTFPSNQITSVDLSNLTIIGNNGLANTFSGNQITSVDLSSLTTVGDNGLNNTFPSNQITSVDLSNLTIIGNNGLESAFYDNQITSVNLSNLTTIGDQGLTNAFSNNRDSQGQTTLTSVSFPALNSQSFGESTDQFTEMLTDNEGVTVHFPSNLQNVIGDWDDVTNGFGGSNTTVLFDLPATK